MSSRSRSSRPPVVLIADDQEWSVRSLESVLGPRGYAVLRAFTGQQALTLARTANPDAVILDYGMPDMSGAEVCALLREDPRFPLSVPIVVVATGGDSRAHVLDAFRAGAWEVCVEPLDAEILCHKLDRFLEAKLFSDQMRDQSLVDSDSGLYNLRGVARRARELGADLSRRNAAVSCVAFTPANDDTATDAGLSTAVAQYLGGVCRRATRRSDIAGRIGPSEYAVLAPATLESGASRLTQRIADTLIAQPFQHDGHDRLVELRIVTSTVPNLAESPFDPMDLLQRTLGDLRTTIGVRARTSPFVGTPVPAIQ